MKRLGTKLILRVLSEDEPVSVADAVGSWIAGEMSGREYSERDTEIVVVIGLDPS